MVAMSILGDLFEEGENLTGSDSTGLGTSEKTKLPPPPRLPSGLCGIYNQGATCYLNSLIQTLVMTPELRDALFRLPRTELGNLEEKDIPGSKVRVIPLQLQRLFSEILLLDAQGAKTAALTESFGWGNNEEFVQHDAQELNRILFSAIEDSLVGTSGQNIIHKLYHGVIVNQIKCLVCGKISEREEDFLDLCVAVSGAGSLEEALQACYVETERMEGKNQYRCDACDKLVDAEKGAKLRHLPPILTVSMLRFSFDFDKMERYKETGKFTFPMELKMSPYNEGIEEGIEYELYSVVIHKGSTHGGHYHAFIRDVDALGKWTHPDEDTVSLPTDPSTGKVDFLEFDSPVELIETLLLRNDEDGISTDKLCGDMVKDTGISWNKRFKRQYGPINKFLKKHDDKFEYYQEANWVALKSWKPTQFESQPQGDKPTAPKIPIANDKIHTRPKSPPSEPGHCWFDFDDSRIRPISTREIEKQFSGKASAYMLFYRQKCLNRPNDAMDNPSYGVPEDLIEEVLIKNSIISMERCEHERKINTITLTVHHHLFWEYYRGSIRPVEGDTGNTEQQISVDRRKPIRALIEEVKRAGANFVPSVFKLNVIKKLEDGYHLYECVSDDESKTVSETSLRNNSEIFVWNGETIDECVYRAGEEYEPIRVNIAYGNPETTFNYYCKKMSCHELKMSIGEVTNIDPQSLLLRRVVEVSEGKMDLKTILREDENKTLEVVGLKHGDLITVEDIYGTESTFDATRYLNQINEPKKETVISIKIENRCFGKVAKGGAVSYDTVSLDVDRDSTVEMLKAMTMSLTDVGDADCRMRVEDDNRGLQPPLHEDQGVLEAGLYDGAKLVLEEGIPPTSSQITVTFTPGNPKSDISDMEITLDQKTTISECVQLLCQKAGLKDPSEWHIRLTNWCGEAAAILEDMDARLDQCDVKNGNHLLLQEGKLPPKGFVKMPVYLFPTLHSVKQEEAGNDIIWRMQDCSTNDPSDSCDPDKKLTLIGEIIISKLATLEQLKTQIMTLDSIAEHKLIIPLPAFLRISVLSGGILGTVLKGNQNTLQRLKITSSSELAIQVLAEEEDLSVNQFLLRLRTRIAGCRKYGTCVEMVWDTSNGVSPPCLRQAVADALAINVERIVVAKRFTDKYEWMIITEQKQGNQKKGKKRAKCNVKNAPYHIKDNDVLGVKNLEYDPMNDDNFSTVEDEEGKERLKIEAEERKLKREELRKNAAMFDAGAGGDSGSKGKRREVGIKIHVGDFR